MTQELRDATVLVTGGTGSIGRALVDELLRLDAKRIVVFSRDEMKQFNLRRELAGMPVDTVIGDVRDWRAVDDVCWRYSFDVVFHVAAMKHVSVCEDSAYEAVLTNVTGTQNVLDAARHRRIPKVVVVSTDKSVLPTNVLGATKMLAERLTVQAAASAISGQAFCCVRFGNVLGSRGSVIPVWVDTLRNGLPVRITSPAVTRFGMRIDDAARLIVRAGSEARGGEVFILKMKSFALDDLATVMKTRIAPLLERRPEEVEIVTTGLVQGEKLHEDLISADEVARLCELADTLVVLPNSSHVDASANGGDRCWFSSRLSPRMTLDELESLVREYLLVSEKEC